MRTLGYILLFTAVQAVALVLAIVGLPICALCAYCIPGRIVKSRVTRLPILTFPKWAWLWSNDEDGVYPTWYARINYKWSMSRVSFVWTALRNPVNNFRFVPGVSKPGRPLFYRHWGATNYDQKDGWYFKAGWAAKTGWPMLSAGAGRGY